MPNICILYGFCEGPRVGRRFEKALARAGYKVTKDAEQADILITHSGGCYLLPPTFRAKRIVHIGPWYWPGRPWAVSGWQKFKHDFTSHHQEGELRFWLGKSLWNFVYLWNFRAFGMLRGKRLGTPWPYGAITTIVRPAQDSFCTPDLANMPFTAPPTIRTMPGYHDDCWRNPAPYIALIQS